MKWWHWVIIGCVGVIAGLGAIVVISTRSHSSGETELKAVMAKVSRHVILPTDETPALATITDPSKLKNNKFLSQGHTGDKVLIYAKWQNAVLYRPSADRVVAIGPVDVAASPSVSATPTATPAQAR